MTTLDLSGEWSYRTDPDDRGVESKYYLETFESEGFRLPGSTCENGIGKKQEYYDGLTREAVRAPRERYEYIGALWLQKEVRIPESMSGKSVRLFLERVNIASQLWLDGEQVGRQIIELSAPHIYDLTGRLTPGAHTLTLRIDNRNLLNFGDMASGYSIDTQGIWCGAVGRIELQCEEIFHVENIQIYPRSGGIRGRMTLANNIFSPWEKLNAEIKVSVTSPSGTTAAETRLDCVLFNSRQVEEFELDFDNIEPWNEFSPNLYILNIAASSPCGTDEKSVRFGMRTVKTENKKILLNGKQISLRGTIDCAQYPLTGYPPFDIDLWRNNFKTLKSYGLNHVRFHAWCPPECAFSAADEVGIYLSVEMPLWINRDVTPLEYGDDPIHDMYYPQEARTISKLYGNHPSFIMFSNGNETMGNFELLSDITTMMRAYDPRRLYTLTSNFDHPVMSCEDYICTQESYGNHVRIQHQHDIVAESTYLDYSKAVTETPVPIITFEVGQYCSYPDVDICERYTGNMLPVNFDAIRKHMINKGVYPRLREYVAASGDLAAKLYKEDIEAALRTHGLGGFELLSLTDYTGQSTATVGMLDVFFESKGIITPEEWRRFCAPVVPLFKSKRIYKNTECLVAELDLYDFGAVRIKDPIFRLTICIDGKLFFETTTADKTVSVPLDGITKASMLTITLSVGENSNSWRVFVYPECGDPDPVWIISTADELDEMIATGGSAVVSACVFSDTADGSFVPVFWSPVHFPTNRPSGEIIDSTHPIFDCFPTEKYPDYQWKTLLDNSLNVDITRMNGLSPIVEVVPNFVDSVCRSPLFEMRVGNAKLLICGFDLSKNDLPTLQLKKCISGYVNSARFEPMYNADAELIRAMTTSVSD